MYIKTNAKKLQRSMWKLFNYVASTYGINNRRIVSIKVSGLPSPLQVESILYEGKDLCIGLHKAPHIQTVVLFGVSQPEAYRKETDIYRVDGGDINTEGNFIIRLSEQYKNSDLCTEESMQLIEHMKSWHERRLLELDFGGIVPLAACSSYTPFAVTKTVSGDMFY